MDKILSISVGGNSALNIMVASTDDGGIFMSKHDLSRVAGMVYNGTATLHSIDKLDTNTCVLRIKLANAPAHLSFVTAHPSGSVKIGKDDLNRIIAHFTGLSGYHIKMGLLDMPRLAA